MAHTKPTNPTRFPAGINNASITENLGLMGQLDPTKFQTFAEDFIAAPVALGTFTAIVGPGGLATVATTVTVGTPLASFGLNASKRYFFKARLSLAAVANSITVGIADALTGTAQGTTLTIANNVLTLQNFGGTARTVTANTALVNATMFTLGFAYTPNRELTAYVNDVAVASITDITALSTSNLIAGIRPSLTTATVDYIFAAVER